MTKIPVTCLCPQCGTQVPITIGDAARVMRNNRKQELPTSHFSGMGKKSSEQRWEGHVKKAEVSKYGQDVKLK